MADLNPEGKRVFDVLKSLHSFKDATYLLRKDRVEITFRDDYNPERCAGFAYNFARQIGIKTVFTMHGVESTFQPIPKPKKKRR